MKKFKIIAALTIDDLNKQIEDLKPDQIGTVSANEVHDNYTYGECLICNQWIEYIAVCIWEEKSEGEHV